MTMQPERGAVLRAAAAAGLVMAVCAGVAMMRLWPGAVAGLVHHVSHAEADLGVAGWLLAFGVQTAIALCGVLPASAGAMAAGMAFGVVGGFCVSSAATFVGAMLAFLLARGLFRQWIERKMANRPRMARLDEAITRDGWRLVVLMRLSPIMPFAATSYMLGLTSLRLHAYLIGTLAMMPALLAYVAMGSLARAGIGSWSAGHSNPWHLGLLVLAFAASALLALRLARIVSSVLRKPLLPAEPSATAQP